VTAVLLADDEPAAAQRALHLARRARLRAVLEAAGFTVDHSEASLHLWATRGEDCHRTAEALAGLGVLVAPGDRFGPAGGRHVRVAFAATDEELDAVAARLTPGRSPAR
jgi:aspartate/methionine/tyrosine aminotransferase